MDGKFIKNKTPYFALFLLMSGVYDVVISGRLLVRVGFSSGRNSLFAILFVLLGLALCVLCVLALCVRRNMRLHIESGHISGVLRFGQKLECDVSEIEYAEAGVAVLSIKLKSGKLYTITGLKNAMELYDCIRGGLEPVEEMCSRETLEEEVRKLKDVRKKAVSRVYISMALWFADILLCVALTGARDLGTFSVRDWLVFGVMMTLLAGIVVSTFVMAVRAGKYLPLIQEKSHRLRRVLLESEPLGKGKCRKILADDGAFIRVVIYGFPNAEDAYLTIEAIDRQLRLCCVYESPIYPSEEEMLAVEKLPRPLEGMRKVYSE